MEGLNGALVTGAGRGIGFAISCALAELGYGVSVTDVDQVSVNSAVERLRAMGLTRVTGVVADVGHQEEVVDAVDSTVDAFGALDVCVANAGIAFSAAMVDTTVEQWERIVRVNILGVANTYTAAARQMISQGTGGVILGAASIAGRVATPQMSAYSASKFAVVGLTQAAAQELGEFGIRVNAYCPGIVETDMMLSLADDLAADAADITRDDVMRNYLSRIALGRLAQGSDVANLVKFLVSSESAYITGQSLVIDGGMGYA